MSDFLNKYPYTDFHELNLDWVIERVKKLTENWLTTQEAWNNTQEQWQELYNYVHDYFDNLDVSQEISDKIDAMVLDGTFLNVIRSTVEAQTITSTTSWLAAHITQPTTPAIDTSLTIAGAAADAKAAGDKINVLRYDLDNSDYSQFYEDDYIIKIPHYEMPFKTGERYITRAFLIPMTAGTQILYKIGTLTDAFNVRIEFVRADGTTISGISIGSNTAAGTASPADTAFIRVMLNALGNVYAVSDGIAIFNDIWLMTASNFAKAYTADTDYSVNANGIRISYTGRNMMHFFKDHITIFRNVNNQYTYVWVYDDLDFSTFTGKTYNIANNVVTEINEPGKYLLVKVDQSSYSSVLINHEGQYEHDASEFNSLINTSQAKYARFFWFSDTHNDYRNAEVLDSVKRAKADAKFCAEHMTMDFFLQSGDLIAQSMYSEIGDANSLRFMSKELKEYADIGKLIFAVGNHDGLQANQDFINTTLYSIGYDHKNEGNQYFYFDNDGLGVRYIVLAIPDNNNFGPTVAQMNWLINTALDTDYNVVVITHITPLSDMYSSPCLADILNDFSTKSSGTNTVYDGGVWVPVSWDFTGGSSGKCMVVMGGHLHADYALTPHESVVIDGNTKTNPFDCPLVTIRNTFYDAAHGDTPYSDTAYAYDICILNITGGTLSLIRRGNGSDRVVSLNI